jgi:gliding motility-associated lipoprotein GldH
MILYKRFIGFLSISTLCMACSPDYFFNEDKAIEGNIWKINQKITFDKDINDTIGKYNFYLNLRTTTSYEYSNLYIFFETEFPDGRHSKDTIECPLAAEDGTWLGKTSGSLIENKILFKTRVIFPVAGNYKFSIQHAMRNDNLEEITDVGLCIEKIK